MTKVGRGLRDGKETVESIYMGIVTFFPKHQYRFQSFNPNINQAFYNILLQAFRTRTFHHV